MHRCYKTYINSFVTITMLASAYIFMNYETNMPLLALLIAVYAAVLEIVMLTYTQNSGASFQGTVTLLAVFLYNPAVCVSIITITLILETIAFKLINNEYLFNSYDKLLYNWAMRVISILSAKVAFYLLSSFNGLLAVIAASFMNNAINALLLMIVIYLYTNDKDDARVHSIHSMVSFLYISVLINILQFYGYEAYGINAIVVIFMLLMPFQTSILEKALEQEIKESVFLDSLTKAYNKASLSKQLTDYLHGKVPFTIVFMDFDNFKVINDTYGHDVGDKILQHFANSVKGNLRKTDKLYRFGGDEFCLIVDKDCDIDVVIDRTYKLKDNLIFEEGNLKIPYTFTIGKYRYTGEDTLTEEEIIGTVSHRMLQNKLKMQMNMA
ncbi:MAG: GGDEF domain-containing protein [Sedimentibacter sp.]